MGAGLPTQHRIVPPVSTPKPFTGPAEVYFVHVKFTKRKGYGASAGVKGGRVATLAHALTRKAACRRWDPLAKVTIYRSNTMWEEVEA